MAHVKPGDPLVIHAAERNGWEDASDDFRRRMLGGSAAPTGLMIPPGTMMLKNTSGGNLVAGRVLEVGSSLLTTFDRRYPWFNGSTPAPNGTKAIGVNLFPMASNDFSWCMVSGVCEARVNINHEQQMWADVDSGSTLLQSKWYGRAEIISRESTGTGEKNCKIRMGAMHLGPIDVEITQSGGIAPNASGSAKVQLYDDVDASPTSTITVYYTRMPGSDNAGETQHAEVFWVPRKQAFVIYELQCAG